jgi:hypothetical protein
MTHIPSPASHPVGARDPTLAESRHWTRESIAGNIVALSRTWLQPVLVHVEANQKHIRTPSQTSGWLDPDFTGSSGWLTGRTSGGNVIKRLKMAVLAPMPTPR